MRQCLPPLSFSLCSSWLMDPSNQIEAKAFLLPKTTKTTETKDSKCHVLVLFFIFLTNKQIPNLRLFQNESTNANNHKATRSAQNLIETPRFTPGKQHHGHRKHHHGSMCHPSKAWSLAIKPGAPDLVCSIPSRLSHGNATSWAPTPVLFAFLTLLLSFPLAWAIDAQYNPNGRETKLGRKSVRELATYL
jgi:hypothetical protein